MVIIILPVVISFFRNLTIILDFTSISTAVVNMNFMLTAAVLDYTVVG